MNYDYLIVGGGMTADAAVRGIRESDKAGTIGLIGEEAEGPYNRPPLTKSLWQGKAVDKIWRGTVARGVELHLGRRAVSLDPEARTVTDDAGGVYSYGKLLLATGGRPRRLPFGGHDIIYYRFLDDYRRLRSLTDRGDRFAVIGAGFIGIEIAAALAGIQKQVTMVFPGECLGSRMFPRDLAQFIHSYYAGKGIQLFADHRLQAISRHGDDEFRLETMDGAGDRHEVLVTGAVAGLGIEPNVELAGGAGLTLENGIRVDEGLRTSAPDIFAAGDVASFYNPALDKVIRVEHEDNANAMGAAAGRAMAGQPVRYDYLPYFYSDMFDLGYEAVGELDSSLETYADWQEPNKKGVVYYLRPEGRVTGVLLWNVWGQVDAARALIAERGPFAHEQLKGRLPAG